MTENLFDYGTLQYPHVQQQVLGRTIEGVPDVLGNFQKAKVEIDNNTYFIARAKVGSSIEGIVLVVETEDLPKLDEYETSAYRRIAVTLKSGTKAWAYVE